MNQGKRSAIEQYVIQKAREMRLAKKMSQRELAYQLDLPIGYIGDIESTKRPQAKYNLNHIARLAEIFDCSPKDFLPDK